LAEQNIALLARAARLAPGDPRIALDLAAACIGSAPARAAALFEEVARRHDAAQAWLGLALACDRLGDPPGAAAALGALLSRHCLPADSAFATVAARIARAAGYDGYCGMAADGSQVHAGEGRLLGFPLHHAALRRVEGLATPLPDGGIAGWASRPAFPADPPELTLIDARGRRRPIRCRGRLPVDETAPLLARYRFTVPAAILTGFTPPYALHASDGRPLLGSPLDPAALAATPPCPAGQRSRRRLQPVPPQPLAILVPVYRGLEETAACLEALFAAAPPETEILVVDDATPELPLAAYLDRLAATGRITLLRHAGNRGFCAAVTTGLAAAEGRDVLLLNSDTLVPAGAIATLREVAYARPETGSVTPLSNEATILSFPDPQGGNPMPELSQAAALNALARRVHKAASLPVPTGIGFCMYLRHDCIAATGGFRGEIFAQGYGEENDWCLRAAALGFRHRAALGAYVAHRGGVSFRAGAHGLMQRNSEILERLYPGYHEWIQDFIARDPLRRARAALGEALLAQDARPAVLLITHSHGGGVARRVAERAAELRAQDLRPLVLATKSPENPKAPYPWPAELSVAAPEANGEPDIRLAFALPARLPALLRLLRRLRVGRVELHHTLSHHEAVRGIAKALGVQQDIVVHDYALFCPRISLVVPGTPPRYCGEPGIAGCIACCKRDKEHVFEALPEPALRARSAGELAAAARVIAPSADAARRIARHFPGIRPLVTGWEDDTAPAALKPPPQQGRRRIAVIGGIGPTKGFDLLHDCGRDAAIRNLELDFIVIGRSSDDEKLLRTARIFVTGPYREGEAQGLIAEAKVDLAFLPSICPETWCFALTEAWHAGCYTIAFDLGAQAERIAASGRGALLPLGLPAPRVNDFLLRWAPPAMPAALPGPGPALQTLC
jgi:GT2 family glycosyltransferase/glycosyltransferase involved in cell wall biosynthesis